MNKDIFKKYFQILPTLLLFILTPSSEYVVLFLLIFGYIGVFVFLGWVWDWLYA